MAPSLAFVQESRMWQPVAGFFRLLAGFWQVNGRLWQVIGRSEKLTFPFSYRLKRENQSKLDVNPATICQVCQLAGLTGWALTPLN